MGQRVGIGRLRTGVPGLDELMGGGVPELSLNLIAGSAGSGKTTLAHQLMFSLAGAERRALFFTVVGEPPLKMLRYQQQFDFFDFEKLDSSVKFVNLASDMVDGDFDRLIARIIDEVQEFTPSLVFIDSFRSVMQSAQTSDEGAADLQYFIQQLGMQMTSWQATTFLITEFAQLQDDGDCLFTVADGILWLSQKPRGNTLARQIQVLKMRDAAHDLGAHGFRISRTGLQVFPRAVPQATPPALAATGRRLSTGVRDLDAMLGGGVPAGYSVLLAGPSGSGKSILAAQFLAEGVRAGEKGVIAAFETSCGEKLRQFVVDGEIALLSPDTADLSTDEFLHDLVALIDQSCARRLVIDSLAGFELALADAFRPSLQRVLKTLKAMGVTVMMTAELEDGDTAPNLGSKANAFLADAIVMQRYVEQAGQCRRAIAVVKVRGSSHSKDIRFYDIVDGLTEIGERLA
ncbi:MAG: ATPase domain-containing protein [Pseudomonadota bacterium]